MERALGIVVLAGAKQPSAPTPPAGAASRDGRRAGTSSAAEPAGPDASSSSPQPAVAAWRLPTRTLLALFRTSGTMARQVTYGAARTRLALDCGPGGSGQERQRRLRAQLALVARGSRLVLRMLGGVRSLAGESAARDVVGLELQGTQVSLAALAALAQQLPNLSELAFIQCDLTPMVGDAPPPRPLFSRKVTSLAVLACTPEQPLPEDEGGGTWLRPSHPRESSTCLDARLSATMALVHMSELLSLDMDLPTMPVLAAMHRRVRRRSSARARVARRARRWDVQPAGRFGVARAARAASQEGAAGAAQHPAAQPGGGPRPSDPPPCTQEGAAGRPAHRLLHVHGGHVGRDVDGARAHALGGEARRRRGAAERGRWRRGWCGSAGCRATAGVAACGAAHEPQELRFTCGGHLYELHTLPLAHIDRLVFEGSIYALGATASPRDLQVRDRERLDAAWGPVLAGRRPHRTAARVCACTLRRRNGPPQCPVGTGQAARRGTCRRGCSLPPASQCLSACAVLARRSWSGRRRRAAARLCASQSTRTAAAGPSRCGATCSRSCSTPSGAAGTPGPRVRPP